MTEVVFVKWYPFEDKEDMLHDIVWNKVYVYDYYMDFLYVVNNILQMGFYVAIHKDMDGLVTVMIDTTWFQRR